MSGENQFAVYQMKHTPETRQIRFRSYQTLLERGIRIRQEDYEQVYTGILSPQDSPESVRERLDRQPPRSFAGHSVSVSDVLVFHRAGTVISYYVEKTGFTVIEDFIKKESSSYGSAVTIDTANFQIEGKAGSWLAFDSIRLEGQEFFLMEHETYGKEAAWVVVDGAGKLAVDNVRNGFNQEVMGKLEEYLHAEQQEEDRQEKIQQQPDPAEQEKPCPQQEMDRTDKPRLDNWQKYMENGEYLRSAEISEEQNYNMIDGRKNNGYKAPAATNSMQPKKRPKGRQSVLAKLHKKQAEIAKRSGKRERQQVAENDMERERK
ncbi:MAG: DUF4316 domain-containing protein [Lachnospiraceae bacterium]|nr:DUF4316 domain-containing protein [Lachnospiraceae bacterium]MBD5490183.1 DUF4316 domain-containing protein [Lachnospiraceae bacterium]